MQMAATSGESVLIVFMALPCLANLGMEIVMGLSGNTQAQPIER
jgi:hypothetical protein